MSEHKTLESLASKLDNSTESLIRENVLLRRIIKSLRFERKAFRQDVSMLTKRLEESANHVHLIEGLLQDYLEQKPIEVTKDMVIAFCHAISDADVSENEFIDVKKGLEAALCNVKASNILSKPAVETMQYEAIGANEHENTMHQGYCSGWNDCIDAFANAKTQNKERLGTNEYGLDMGYMTGKLNLFLRDISRYTKSEAARTLARLAIVADKKVLNESEFLQNETLNAAYDAFGIGNKARSHSTLLTNIQNTIRFAEYLHAVEREFLMVPGEPDEDYPEDEPEPTCLVNCWGSDKATYIEQWRNALKLLDVMHIEFNKVVGGA